MLNLKPAARMTAGTAPTDGRPAAARGEARLQGANAGAQSATRNRIDPRHRKAP
jgi:hypothetical protein